MRRSIAIILAATAPLACNVETDTAPATDTCDETPPAVTHTPVTDPQPTGEDVFVEARVADVGTGVALVEIFFRHEGTSEFFSGEMVPVGEGLFQGIIRGEAVAPVGVEYFIRAVDWCDYTGCSPVECDDDPWHFAVVDG